MGQAEARGRSRQRGVGEVTSRSFRLSLRAGRVDAEVTRRDHRRCRPGGACLRRDDARGGARRHRAGESRQRRRGLAAALRSPASAYRSRPFRSARHGDAATIRPIRRARRWSTISKAMPRASISGRFSTPRSRASGATARDGMRGDGARSDRRARRRRRDRHRRCALSSVMAGFGDLSRSRRSTAANIAIPRLTRASACWSSASAIRAARSRSILPMPASMSRWRFAVPSRSCRAICWAFRSCRGRSCTGVCPRGWSI